MEQPRTRGERAQEYAERGWLVFPLHTITVNGTCSCGLKCPTPGKHPRVKWSEEATTDARTISGWWQRWPDANIGIVTGRRSNLYVLDIDVKRSVELGDGTLVPEGQYTLALLEGEHEVLPPTLVANTGSGGEHWYFAYPGSGDHGNRVGFAAGLDIRADGGYVVAPGSNHESGHDYEWALSLPVASPPDWLVERASRSDPERSPLPAPDASVSEGGRNDYLISWAGRYRSLDPSLTEDQLADLLWALNRRQCEPPLAPHEVKKIARSAMNYQREPVPESVLPEGAVEEPPEIPAGADLAWQIGEFMKLEITPPPPLVHGLLDAGTGIMIAGPPGVGKSWLVMHLGLAVATGTPFLDHWEVEQGSVLIIDEEGHPFGDQERFRMLLNGYTIGSLVKVPLYLAIGKGIKLDSPLGLATLQRMIGRYEPRLVIFDSLIRVSSGDEQSAREMASFFAIADTIKQSHGTAFGFVHHCRKPGAEMPADLGDLVRGSSEIKAWLETLLIALPGEMSTDMNIHVNKQRWHKKPEHPFTVRLLTREDEPWAKLGYQGDIVKEGNSTIDTHNRILAVIHKLIQGDLEPSQLRIAGTIGMSPRTIKTHLDTMVAIGLISTAPSRFEKGFIYCPKAEPPKYNGGLSAAGGLVPPFAPTS